MRLSTLLTTCMISCAFLSTANTVSANPAKNKSAITLDKCSIDKSDNFSFCNPDLLTTYEKNLATKPNFNKKFILFKIKNPTNGYFHYSALDTNSKKSYAFPYVLHTADGNNQPPKLRFGTESNLICSLGDNVSFEGNGYENVSLDDTMLDKDYCVSFIEGVGFDTTLTEIDVK